MIHVQAQVPTFIKLRVLREAGSPQPVTSFLGLDFWKRQKQDTLRLAICREKNLPLHHFYYSCYKISTKIRSNFELR